MDLSYYKPLLLPSNDLAYPSLIKVREPDLSLLIRLQGSFLASSESDLIYSAIERFTNVKEPGDLLFRDAYYIWIYIYSLFSKEDSMSINDTCETCRKHNKVVVPISEFISKPMKSLEGKELKSHSWVIKTRKRLLRDNICTGTELVQFSDPDVFQICKAFIRPQILEITLNNEKIDLNYFDDFCLEIGVKNISEVFLKLREEDWGLPDFFLYECSNCFSRSKAYLCDPLRSSFYNQDIGERAGEILETAVTISSTKSVSFKDILAMPLSYWDEFLNIINKIQKEKSGKKDYFDYVNEEMG